MKLLVWGPKVKYFQFSVHFICVILMLNTSGIIRLIFSISSMLLLLRIRKKRRKNDVRNEFCNPREFLIRLSTLFRLSNRSKEEKKNELSRRLRINLIVRLCKLKPTNMERIDSEIQSYPSILWRLQFIILVLIIIIVFYDISLFVSLIATI